MRRIFQRRWLLLVLIPLFLLSAGYVWLLTWPNSGRIRKANFDRIERGMIRLEVEEILDPNARPLVFLDVGNATPSKGSGWSVTWGNPTVPYTDDRPDRFPPGDTIWIEFDRDAHKVISKRYARATPNDYWQHFLTCISVAIGRSPPPPPSPVIAIVRSALPTEVIDTSATAEAPRQP